MVSQCTVSVAVTADSHIDALMQVFALQNLNLLRNLFRAADTFHPKQSVALDEHFHSNLLFFHKFPLSSLSSVNIHHI